MTYPDDFNELDAQRESYDDAERESEEAEVRHIRNTCQLCGGGLASPWDGLRQCMNPRCRALNRSGEE